MIILITSSITIFFSVGDTAKENINYSDKHFSDYLNTQCKNYIFIHPTDSNEIANVISTLNMNESKWSKMISPTKY